jgi:hypothetical protein
MNRNKAAMQVALHEVKHLEQQWRQQMRAMLTAGLTADMTIDTIHNMTYVQKQLDNAILKFTEELK